MELSKYSLSFTTGAALIHESVVVAKLYAESRQWSAVRSQVFEENSFQARTMSTLKKIYGEVSKRLKHLTDAQLELLSTGTEVQIKALIWLAICRQYKFIYDFTIEVSIPHYESARFLLTHDDYDAFFNAKTEWHQNLDVVSKQTKSKVRQVLFKMMKECDLIGYNNEIQCQYLGEQLRQLIADNLPNDLQLFPGVS